MRQQELVVKQQKNSKRRKKATKHRCHGIKKVWRLKELIKLLKKSDDPYLAMLVYRPTPLENGFSPSELLMNRHLQTNLPMTETQLKPKF